MNRKKINLIMISFFLLFVFVLPQLSKQLGLFEFDWKKYYQEVIAAQGEGEILRLNYSKGGDGTLILRRNRIKSTITVSGKNVHLVKKGDYFVKIKDSNKCMVRRNDSIIYLDCMNFYPPEIRDVLGEIQEWPRETIGKWELIH